MTSKDIKKLEQADQLMFNLTNSSNPKEDILKVGQLLKEAGILEDASNLQTIVDPYNQNAQDEIKNAIRKNKKFLFYKKKNPPCIKTKLISQKS